MRVRISDIITHITSLAVLLTAAAGCTPTVRSTGGAPYPGDGIYLLYSRDGRLIQETVWRGGALIAAWQYEVRTELPMEVINAVNRGERDWPAPRWIQAVKRGNGRLTYLDEDGRDIGFADYHQGQYVRGAH